VRISSDDRSLELPPPPMFHAKPRNILPLCTPSEAERSPSEVEGLTERSRGGGGMYIGVLVSASLDEQFMSVAEERFFHFIFHSTFSNSPR
jgi:hypothetical protein